MDIQILKSFLLTLNPTHLTLFFILSITICLFWLSISLYLDRQAPEPKKQILKVFSWGSFIVFPVLFITGPISVFLERENWLNHTIKIFISSFLLDGLFEEWAKYAVLSDKVYNSKYFDEPRDGIIYGMFTGLGFSLMENLLYTLTYTDLKTGVPLVLLRGVTTMVMHFLSAAIIGYHLGIVKFFFSQQSQKKKNLIIVRGLILAILFHGLYNTIVRFGFEWLFIPLIILLLIMSLYIILGLRRMNKFSNQQLNQKV
jgi:RsiW-degrading membrane proteinase PrsW (M82 family)